MTSPPKTGFSIKLKKGQHGGQMESYQMKAMSKFHIACIGFGELRHEKRNAPYQSHDMRLWQWVRNSMFHSHGTMGTMVDIWKVIK